MAVALDGPRKEDVLTEVKGVQVAIDPVIDPFMHDAMVDLNQLFFIKQLSVRSKLGTC